jgi:hypothetical protein
MVMRTLATLTKILESRWSFLTLQRARTFETPTSMSSLIGRWTILNQKESVQSTLKTRVDLKARATSLTPRAPNTKEACEVAMLQNHPINNRLSPSSRSAAEEQHREKAKTTGLEARAKRRRKEKVGLVTEINHKRRM